MRITIVTRIFAPEPSAASQRLGSLASALTERGDTVTVLTSRPPDRAATADDPLTVRRWPVIRDRSGYVRGYVPYLSFDIPAFLRLLFARRPDIVLVEPPPTTGAVVRVVCWLKSVPYAYYAADIWSLAAPSTGAPTMVVRAVQRIEQFALRGAAVVLAVSPGVANEVRRLSPDADIAVVGHGVDDRVFHSEVVPMTPEVDAAYVGTASEWHGARVFTAALALLRGRDVRPRVVFIGQGSDWEQLKEDVREAGLADQVTFSGPVAGAEAARRLRGARVALASARMGIGYDFAVPTKMYSAAAVGTPTVISGSPELRDLVESEGLGWACSDDPAEVADAIEAATRAQPARGVRDRIASWARENVSARAVAARVAAALDRAVADTRGHASR